MESFEVIIIGSGFAGICAAIKLKKQGINNFIILERETELGGTWWRNNYPGAAVDVVSTLYSLSFEPYNWSRLYAKQPEILNYTKNIIKKYDLNAHAKTKANVTLARYDENSSQWRVTIESGQEYSAPILINAIGHLSQPVIPDIPGINNFKGKYFHTAKWDHSYDYKEKRIGIIGTGASSIQVVPAIADSVNELHVFQRTPHWIVPRHDRTLNTFEKTIQKIPLFNRLKRALIYWKNETRILAFQYFPKLMQLIAEKEAVHHLHNQVPEKTLQEELTPDYTIGCKRILISDEYYPALQKDNVFLETSGIQEIKEDGIRLKNGKEITLDCLVFATGFHAFTSNKCLPFDIIGTDGISLKQEWQNKAHAFVGVTVPGFPNLFNINGPNTGIGHTSAIFMTEAQVEYIISSIQYIKNHNISSVTIKPEVEQQYNDYLQRAFKNSVWVKGGCNSWYQTTEGENTTIFPSFTFLFKLRARKFNPKEHLLID